MHGPSQSTKSNIRVEYRAIDTLTQKLPFFHESMRELRRRLHVFHVLLFSTASDPYPRRPLCQFVAFHAKVDAAFRAPPMEYVRAAADTFLGAAFEQSSQLYATKVRVLAV
jgi:hypothetical protein